MLAIFLLKFSLSNLNILITISLNSVFGSLLASVSFSSFPTACFIFFHWDIFLCLLILAASLFVSMH